MKKIIFILVWVAIIYSCVINIPIKYSGYNYTEESENKEEVISRLEKKEFYSGTKNNLLFFNLAFGMNLTEVEKNFSKLKNENIIEDVSSLNGVLGASYKMNYHDYSNIGKVYCFFDNNKLKEIQIDTLNQNNNLLDLFIKKYGEADYLAENEFNKEYHWVDGNRHLTIFEIADSNRLLIQYSETTEKVRERNENILDRLGVYYKA